MSKSRAHLVLIDGNAVLHRAYHALPPLTDKEGNETHAIYGFLSMLLKIVADLKPTHLIVCFDRPEPTFRKSMYVGYQAHRPKMDDSLATQLNRTKEVVAAMNIPIYEIAGYEADDVIGTLAKQADNRQSTINNQQFLTIIITGDRDILQLVDNHTKVYMPIQGLTNAKLYDEEAVVEKFGVKSSQIVDYKALAGDASDNYPGVRGIGPKTASELLQKFGTIENVYQAIKDKTLAANGLSEKVLKALTEYAEDCVMAKKLATIITDAPVTLELAKAEVHDLATNEALAELEQLGFSSIMKRLLSSGQTNNETKQKSEETKKEEQSGEQLSFI
ncbi:MAG TPA: 5'-3' exonuclease H3TH domain-containing protein [Patescibacteria group bacterium]|nr:5'-3' exonuclease H3TH domain-containing protein [Patescibacteria group bacterium]